MSTSDEQLVESIRRDLADRNDYVRRPVPQEIPVPEVY